MDQFVLENVSQVITFNLFQADVKETGGEGHSFCSSIIHYDLSVMFFGIWTFHMLTSGLDTILHMFLNKIEKSRFQLKI